MQVKPPVPTSRKVAPYRPPLVPAARRQPVAVDQVRSSFAARGTPGQLWRQSQLSVQAIHCLASACAALLR